MCVSFASISPTLTVAIGFKSLHCHIICAPFSSKSKENPFEKLVNIYLYEIKPYRCARNDAYERSNVFEKLAQENVHQIKFILKPSEAMMKKLLVSNFGCDAHKAEERTVTTATTTKIQKSITAFGFEFHEVTLLCFHFTFSWALGTWHRSIRTYEIVNWSENRQEVNDLCSLCHWNIVVPMSMPKKWRRRGWRCKKSDKTNWNFYPKMDESLLHCLPCCLVTTINSQVKQKPILSFHVRHFSLRPFLRVIGHDRQQLIFKGSTNENRFPSNFILHLG